MWDSKLPAPRLLMRLGGTGAAPESGDAATLTPQRLRRDAGALGRPGALGLLVCSRFSRLTLGCWQTLKFLSGNRSNLGNCLMNVLNKKS